jgi:hypothetical protein
MLLEFESTALQLRVLQARTLVLDLHHLNVGAAVASGRLEHVGGNALGK